jgi:hypothetical protein
MEEQQLLQELGVGVQDAAELEQDIIGQVNAWDALLRLHAGCTFLTLLLLPLTCRHWLILLLLLHQQPAHLMLKQVCGRFMVL